MRHGRGSALRLLIFAGLVLFACCKGPVREKPEGPVAAEPELWKAPDTADIPHSPEGDRIRYGRSLIANTGYYLGPKGKVASITNGMACQNCHLDAGTRPWGNHYGRATATFPNYRDRSGTIETLSKRVNDCIERSLNGKVLDSASEEMQAILAYMSWLGKDVPKGSSPHGSGIRQLEFLDRPADPVAGELIYKAQCQRCHGADGGGALNPDGITYQYPPLWGDHSYTTAAGLFRLSKIAGYILDNMPYDSANLGKRLLVGDAWDVGAFINSQPRPVRTFKQDWPDISTKPPDHPFAPFVDSFPLAQHKYGPFGPIVAANKAYKKSTATPGKKQDKN